MDDVMTAEWISVKEAADLYGISENYFRRNYCEEANPRVPIRSRKGPKGGRRILVLKAAVQNLIERETRASA